jgi:hypothetical protein
MKILLLILTSIMPLIVSAQMNFFLMDNAPTSSTFIPSIVPSIAWYKLNASSGTNVVDSINANNGWTTNSPTWSTITFKSVTTNCLVLNGTTQYAYIPDVVTNRITNSWSISCWIMLTNNVFGANKYSNPLEKSDSSGFLNYAISMNSTSATASTIWIHPYYDPPSGSVTDFPSNAIPTNVLWYVACTWDSVAKVSRLYTNGVLSGTSGTETLVPKAGTAGVLDIGADWGGSGSPAGYFPGSILDVKIDGVVWTAGQISNDYLNGPY